MAHFVWGAALGNFGDPFDVVDMATLKIRAALPDFARGIDANGDGIAIKGTGLTYAAGTLSGGTVTSVRFFNAAGASLLTVTGGNYDAVALVKDVVAEQSGDVLFAGNDLVEGSIGRNVMFGLAGNDTLKGLGGADVLVTMDGVDKLYGGAGKDVFVFVTNRGRDQIMDFADKNLANDDLIYVSRAEYDSRKVTQVGDDVLLEFGTHGSLLILNERVDQLGIDDFTFRLPAVF